MQTITFTGSNAGKRAILAILGKDVDQEGYIIEKKTGKRVVAPNGEDVSLSSFAGVRKGSEVYITDDLPSLLEQAEYIK